MFARFQTPVCDRHRLDERRPSGPLLWRPHRSYLININHIKEVVPWFKSSFMLKMNDKRASEIDDKLLAPAAS